jgi:HK97 family phage prohead protease
MGEKAEWLKIGTGGVVPMHFDPIVEKDDAGPGTVSGWASVFGNVDLQADIVMHGTFAKTLKDWRGSKRAIALTNGHDNSALGVVGHATSLTEMGYGLKLAGQWSSTSDAQAIRAKTKEGSVGGMSIFGPVIRASFEDREGQIIRIIHEAALLAVAITPVPANQDALITASKSLADLYPDDDDPKTKVWVCDMKSALSITSKEVRRAALDLLIKGYPATVAEPVVTPGAPPLASPATPAPTTSEPDDASAYALSIIGESGPRASAPGGEPSDSLADLLAIEKATTSFDLDAALAEFGQIDKE